MQCSECVQNLWRKSELEIEKQVLLMVTSFGSGNNCVCIVHVCSLTDEETKALHLRREIVHSLVYSLLDIDCTSQWQRLCCALDRYAEK